MSKRFYLTKERFIILAVVMLVMWSSIFILFWFKGDAITKTPCEICAESYGSTVQCIAIDTGVQFVIYEENGRTFKRDIEKNISIKE